MDGRGQLRLNASVQYGLLTVHVLEARALPNPQSHSNVYVKVSLYPDHSRRAKCKTDVIMYSNNPRFDEKFSFELLEEDLRKRLLLSVWNKDPVSNHSEFLGSMSFGVQHFILQNKVVSGWYYLLTDDLGQHKHLQVVERPAKQLSHHATHSRVFVLRRGASGFGFSMAGDRPVMVSRVDIGSPAESMGVVRDDCIVRINGINVANSQADTVARLVRNCEQELVMEIERVCWPQITSTHTDKIQLDETKHSALPFFFCGATKRRKHTKSNNKHR